MLGKMIDGAETSDGLETEFEMRATEKAGAGARRDQERIRHRALDRLRAGEFKYEKPEGSVESVGHGSAI
jgi:hypothetical protein